MNPIVARYNRAENAAIRAQKKAEYYKIVAEVAIARAEEEQANAEAKNALYYNRLSKIFDDMVREYASGIIEDPSIFFDETAFYAESSADDALDAAKKAKAAATRAQNITDRYCEYDGISAAECEKARRLADDTMISAKNAAKAARRADKYANETARNAADGVDKTTTAGIKIQKSAESQSAVQPPRL